MSVPPVEGRASRRILVVANETVAGRALREEIPGRAHGRDVEVFVVCPVRASRIGSWLSRDRALARTHERLGALLAFLDEIGVLADGLARAGARALQIADHPRDRGVNAR